MKSLLVAAILTTTSLIANAQPGDRHAPAWKFDTSGWTLLGSATVDGRKDRDVITVGRYEGKFDEVTLVVTDSDLQLEDFTIVFGNGEKFQPKTKHTFKEGARSRAIDLPGNDRTIAKIELLYKNTPGGGKAKVEIYGRDKRAKNPTTFDSRGWTLLGGATVDGHRDRDTLTVGKYQGRFDQLTLVVTDSDLDLNDFTIVFGNGERWSPKLKHTFKEGSRSRVVDLPGDDRVIAKLELLYTNKPGGGKAKVEIWAKDTGKRPTTPPTNPPASSWDPSGWTLLGVREVNGRIDRDSIKVGRYQGKFDQLTLVVSDSDLELKEMTITFGNRDKWSPKVNHTFREGARTRAIDLPGNDRTITKVDLLYANLPGGGKAKVELYGRDAKRFSTPPPIVPVTWENKGWSFLGKSTVDGWRDRDKINVVVGQPFTEVMFVVAGSDVELSNITITLGNNEKFEMKDRVFFKEGTRTSPIDIPGKLRKIKSVEFAYANLPGGGRATVEVWGRRKGSGADATPPLPPPGGTPTAPPQPPVVRDRR